MVSVSQSELSASTAMVYVGEMYLLNATRIRRFTGLEALDENGNTRSNECQPACCSR